ncbi:MAG TPA: ADOP family duplicated permease [Gemmatimonadaceae bacterium]|nr:ADOP family duplicated permease [Gemmatimonadaceae bacterium]
MPTRWLDVLRLRIRSLVYRERVDDELDRELRAHVEQQVEEHIANGMTPEAARLAALRSFGGVEQMKEDARDTRGVAVVENLARDLRYTFRGLLREPLLLLAAASSIALGAGGNIAVFSLAREFLLAAPNVRDAEGLVHMQVSHSSHATYQRWRDLRASGALEDVAGYSFEKQINWFAGDAAVTITPMLVTANFFDVVGVPLARGRGFSNEEARAERDPRVAVVSHAFWQRELAADSGVIGRPIMLNGEPYTILGVLAPRVRSVAGLGLAPPVYVPINRSLVPAMYSTNAGIVALVGRVKEGQTLEQARAAVDAVDRRLAKIEGDDRYGGVQEFARVGVARGKAGRTIGAFFALLSLVSLLVLLIACGNVAGLLIARGTTRRREIAIRLAIGGTRARLLQQFLVEGFWLALLGTVCGLGLSMVFMRVVNGIALPIPLPIELHLAPDVPILISAIGLVLLCTLFCALLPALKATRLTLLPALKREEATYGKGRITTRGVLLVGQVTISTLLLVTAFLFVRNLARTHVTQPGFEVEHALVAQLGLVQGKSADDHVALLQRAVERVGELPGVQDAAFADAVPLTVNSGSSNGRSAVIGARSEEEHVEFALSHVGPRYFATLGIRVVQGREFGFADRVGTPRVAIANEEFARRYFSGASPVGQRVRFAGKDTGSVADFEIVGVVANTKHNTIGEEQRAALYYPLLQHPEGMGLAFVFARTGADASPLVVPVRDALGALDRAVAVEVKPMTTALAFAMLPSQIGAVVLGGLGTLGLILATFGLYAIIAFNVNRRVGEIAIRSALGATRGRIVGLVIRDAALLVTTGVVLGLGLAAFVTQPLATWLVTGLSTTDPLSFAGTGAVFIVVSVLASWIPARQATRVSPVIAMRLE